MKFRKSVIVILAINRIKRYTQGYYGKSLKTFKCFKDINFSSESHYNEISTKIRLISIPDSANTNEGRQDLSTIFKQREGCASLSPDKNQKYPAFDALSNMELTLNNDYENQSVTKKLYTEVEYDTLKSVSD